MSYTPVTIPAAPTLNDVIGSSNNVLLGWTDNSSNEDGFKIERKEGTSGTFAQIGTTGANVKVYQDSGLQFGKVYCYRVRAYNSAGNSGYSSEKCATTLATPTLSYPANGATLTTNAVTLTWNCVTGADGYAIKVSKTSCGGGDVFDGASYSCEKALSNLANGTYYWQVQAAATTYPGLSAYSPCRSFTVSYTPGQVPVAYIDSISPNPATQGTHTVSFTGHGTDPDGSVVGYNWRSSKDGQLSTSSSFSKAASGLSVGTHTIYFKVKDDDGAWSTEVTSILTISSAPQPEQIELTLYIHENSTAGPIISGVKIVGTDGASSSFDQTSNSGGYVTIMGMPGIWSFTASRTGYDTKSWSQSITGSQTRHAYLTKQGAEETAPNPPSDLRATAGTSYIQLNWDPPAYTGGSPVTGYRVYRGTSSGSETYYSAVSGTSFKNTAVTSGTIYYYYVTAVNLVGESGASNRVSTVVGVPSLVQLIEQLTIDSVAVSVEGQPYFILTLQHRIDPTTLQLVAESGQTKLYVDANGGPVSDGATAQKIGIIETARELGELQLSQRIALLEGTREAVSEIGGNGWVNLVTSGVVDQIKWQRVYNFEDYLQYWDSSRTTWRNVGTATYKSPPAGLMAKAATALLEKILGDPFEEVADDLQKYLSDAISSYDAIADIDNSEIVDYGEASGFLSRFYSGENNEEIAYCLDGKLRDNIYNLLDKYGPIPSILSLGLNVPLVGQAIALLEFPKLALKAALATDWTVDTIYQSVFNQFEVAADLLYKLTDNAKYSLELAQAHQEVTDYTVKHANAMTTAYEEAAKVPQAVYDYLADIDTWLDSFVTVITLGLLHSPGEFRVYDSQGRVTGLVDGQIREEIPNSMYADETVLIFSSTGFYRYQVVGTDQGTYGLEIVSIEGEDISSLGVTSVPIVSGEVHQYTVESDAFSDGQAVVIIEKDFDNDDEFDDIIETSIPKRPTDPSPVHNATHVSLDTILSWNGDDSGSVAYDVYFSTDANPLLVSERQSETEYSPDLEEATTYYWRIVAINEQGISSGGSVWSFTTGEATPSSPCFVTTATYGSPMAEEVQVLREFRDEYLLTNPVGRTLVDLYYKGSPPIAEFITEHPNLKPVVRAGLLPAVAMSLVVVSITPADKTVFAGLLALVLLFVAVWVMKRRRGGPQHTQF